MSNARRPKLRNFLQPGTLLVAFTSFATLLASTASAEVIGKVILQDYRGATATPDGQPDTKPIYYQDQVSALDTVQTGEGGATSMQFLDETRFDVGPNAMVKLDDFVFDPMSTIGAGKISMAVGAFRYVGGKMKSDENVKLVTPTSTMTIRGTELVIFVGIDGTTEVNVVDGAIDVQVCDKPEVVPATVGQRVIIPPSCTASVTAARPVEDDLAALDVPADLGDFSTAAGGDDGGDPGDGGNGGPGDRDKEKERTDPPAKEPDAGPAPDPDPDPDTGGSGGSQEPDDGCEGGDCGSNNL
jgi:hypothetical protein